MSFECDTCIHCKGYCFFANWTSVKKEIRGFSVVFLFTLKLLYLSVY